MTNKERAANLQALLIIITLAVAVIGTSLPSAIVCAALLADDGFTRWLDRQR